MDEELTQQIEDAINEPASFSAGNQGAQAVSVPDQIKAVQFVEGRRAVAAANPWN